MDLKAIGLRSVFIGVESINQRALKYYNKGIQVSQIHDALKILEQLEISYELGYILFDPYVTCDELVNSINFLRTVLPYEHNKTTILNDYVNILCDTKIEQDVKRDGLLTDTSLTNGFKLNYRFLDSQVQNISDVYHHLLEQVIYPNDRYFWVDVSLSQSLIMLKLNILEWIIKMNEEGQLSKLAVDYFVDKNVVPEIQQIQEKINRVYVQKIRNAIKGGE